MHKQENRSGLLSKLVNTASAIEKNPVWMLNDFDNLNKICLYRDTLHLSSVGAKVNMVGINGWSAWIGISLLRMAFVAEVP